MLTLQELEVYKTAMDIGETISKIIITWNFFDKDTLGKQLIRSADSIALNISEGYGRYSFKENKMFCYYSRGSAYETQCALKKAHQRALINDEIFSILNQQITSFLKLLNGYIRYITKVSNQIPTNQ